MHITNKKFSGIIVLIETRGQPDLSELTFHWRQHGHAAISRDKEACCCGED